MPKPTKGPTADEVYQQLHGILGAHDRDAVLEILRRAIACPDCGGALMRWCQACLGRMGGQKLTRAKRRQLKNAAKQQRPGRRKQPPPAGA